MTRDNQYAAASRKSSSNLIMSQPVEKVCAPTEEVRAPSENPDDSVLNKLQSIRRALDSRKTTSPDSMKVCLGFYIIRVFLFFGV